MNSYGVAYGEEVECLTASASNGVLQHTFSTSDTTRVRFSQGNLQYQASTDSWRFAANQYDYAGEKNQYTSSTYNGWIDLFGWATSGYHNPADTYNTRFHPWDIDTSTVNPAYNRFGYGPSKGMPDSSLTGTSANYDWGVYNAIYNGGNQSGLWHTLSAAEMVYLIEKRPTSTVNGVANARYCLASANGVNGLIIFPDTYTHPANVPLPNAINTHDDLAYAANVYTASQWQQMEDAGCVFLPAGGLRTCSTVEGEEWAGVYWLNSKVYALGDSHPTMFGVNGYLLFEFPSDVAYGLSVRLVQDTKEPIVETEAPFSIGSTETNCRGRLVSEGGAAVTEKGFCWSANHTPTIADGHAAVSANDFAYLITNLEPGTTYYVRAYATNRFGTAYGEEIPIATRSIYGSLGSTFSTSATTTVQFSQGNLQYRAQPNDWRFADGQQYATINNGNALIGPDNTNYIDLFGWATSGYHEPNDAGNINYQPWATSTTRLDNQNNYYGYGPSSDTTQYDISGAKAEYDWGVHNAISNGGNQPGLWRTMSASELNYLFTERTASKVNDVDNARYCKAQVDGRNGIVLFPDTYTHPASVTLPEQINNPLSSFNTNTYNAIEWQKMDAAGCVFLPAAGWRLGNTPSEYQEKGFYWLSTGFEENNAFALHFSDNLVYYTTLPYYGGAVRLVIGDKLPKVATSAVMKTGSSSAEAYGEVTDTGGAAIIAQGVCWSSYDNPTLANSHAEAELGRDAFSIAAENLMPNVTYNFRAYATNSFGTAYGSAIAFKIPSNPNDLDGAFSTSDSTAVRIAPGNLQFKASENTWRFAEEQYDIMSSNNQLASENYNGWIDLYSWGTSGYHNPADPYNTKYHPWSIDDVVASQQYNYYGFGPSTNMADTNLTGTSANYDWGVYNAISNGGDQAGLWRTPTAEEWKYILEQRQATTVNGTANARFCTATVNGVHGLIVFPDNYFHPYHAAQPDSLNSFNTTFACNNYDYPDWKAMEEAGCVFLPICGRRNGMAVTGSTPEEAYYWSSTAYDKQASWALTFGTGTCSAAISTARWTKSAVRLVQDLTPAVRTNSANKINYSSAELSGEAFDEGASAITARGLCWSTHANPTIDDSHQMAGTGLGVFIVHPNALRPNTLYHVRAYAINSQGIAYGEDREFMTLAPTPGSIGGNFSTSDSTSVTFSRGNLQYQASTNTWCFAQHQYDVIGQSNENAKATYNGWIDLFGWGTSGYHNANDPYNTHCQPWDTNSTFVNQINKFGYGPSLFGLSNNLIDTLANYDWGVYNSISNGGDQVGLWRTPTSSEWDYILHTRSASTVNGTPNARYCFARVDTINCFVLFPDNYTHPSDVALPSSINSNSAFTTNQYSFADWQKMETAGCVLLPCTGLRVPSNQRRIDISWLNAEGRYWTATGYDDSQSQGITIENNNVYLYPHNTFYGQAVRLVQDNLDELAVHTNNVTNISGFTADCAGAVLGTGQSPVTDRGLCWSTHTGPTTDDSVSTFNSGVGIFGGTIYNLSPNTTYYIRAYATNREGTIYGEERMFNTLSATPGALGSAFSTSDTTKVVFSQGNLQYQAITNTWRFASHQYDYVGEGNIYISPYNAGWIDLFGWGTSGYHNPADTANKYYQPWSVSGDLDIVAQGINYYGYGPSRNMPDTNLTGTSAYYDWGVFNAISNGGNEANLWRTLAADEWNYLLLTRSASTVNGIENARFFEATVNGTCCLVLLPDMYTHPSGVPLPVNINETESGYAPNTYSIAQWKQLEDAGCVLLPSALHRIETHLSGNEIFGGYWSSTNDYLERFAKYLCFDYNYLTIAGTFHPRGCSVRLVQDHNGLTVRTTAASNIGSDTAVCGGRVLDQGESEVTARGVCWSTSHNPTVANSHTSNGTGAGVFAGTVSGLEPNTLYYFRAYATNSDTTVYGEEMEMLTASATNGALNCAFSITDSTTVYFSQGNLQYQASTNTWRFAQNQYDFVGSQNSILWEGIKGNVAGSDNTLVSSAYNGWVDLFGWGTSGYHNSNDLYNVNYKPWSTNIDEVNPTYNLWGYGPSTYMPDANITGTSANYDWGVYNAISNGGNRDSMWRTLSYNEWNYILLGRSASTVNGTANARFCMANVNGVNGLILFPDTYTHPANVALPIGVNVDTLLYELNSYTAAEWKQMETAGCVLLPAAGTRAKSTEIFTTSANRSGNYWSSTHNDTHYAYNLSFSNGNGAQFYCSYGYYSYSVRLVQDNNLPMVSTSSVYYIDKTSAISGGNVTMRGASDVTARGVCWSTNHNPTIADAHTNNGNGLGSFRSEITGLETNTIYYVRAYATNSYGTAYGEERSFITASETYGLMDGLFSVSDSTTVQFSQGNLQYQASTGTWRMAQNQYDYVGSQNPSIGAPAGNVEASDNNLISQTYNGWIDLFGWGTANTDGKVPYQSSTNSADYADASQPIADTYFDWGKNNYISNSNRQPNYWRTPAQSEWEYLFNTRAASTVNGTANARYCRAKVDGVSCVILFPDRYTHPNGVPQPNAINENTSRFASNLYSTDEWLQMQAAGCVLLPAGGTRYSTTTFEPGMSCYYWTSTNSGSQQAYLFGLTDNVLGLYDDHTYYGNSVRLVHNHRELPTVTTSMATSFDSTTVACGGEVTENGGLAIQARGVCWSTSHNPTIEDGHTTDGTGLGTFNSTPSGLTPNTIYFFRAYATNSEGTGYGEEMEFITASTTYGALNGLFATSDTTAVHFSQGNLQYQAATNTWRFAQKQSDFVGSSYQLFNKIGTVENSDNMSIGADYTGWIDLLGWGTSGYNDKYPYLSSQSEDDYADMHNPIAGTEYDWGVYNAIINGGNLPGMWRTLTAEEWHYLLYERPASTVNHTANARFCRATIPVRTGEYYFNTTNPIIISANCIVLFPDNYVQPNGVRNFAHINDSTIAFGRNQILADDWKKLEAAGCVMLPVAGRRDGHAVTQLDTVAAYWTSSNLVENVGSNFGIAAQCGYADNESMYLMSTLAHYGASVRLVQDNDLPAVCTAVPSNETSTSATCGGEVFDEGESAVTARGVCWSNVSNPTIADNHTADGAGLGTFTSTISGLEPQTVYHVRAYAATSTDTVYGAEVLLRTLSTTPGVINSDFSITDSSSVKFSQGNLQYQASTATWRFAEHQYDYVGGQNSWESTRTGNVAGSDNVLVSATYTGWIDLFGFGTSGYETNFYYRPYDAHGYSHYFGPYNKSLIRENAQSDWGVYNAISNGGNHDSLWRTLTSLEWNYLLNTRTASMVNGTPNARYCKAKVGDVNCVILFPDRYEHPAGVAQPNSINNDRASYASNTFSNADWLQMEAAGCVLLPAAGVREDRSTYCAVTPDTNGHYWTSWGGSNGNADCVEFGPYLKTTISVRSAGLSVRLVQDNHDDAVLPISRPTVKTQKVTNVHTSSAAVFGSVEDNGALEITATGICCSTDSTYLHVHQSDYESTCNTDAQDAYICLLNDLQPNTTYYARAYATNSLGTSYGEMISFTTTADGALPSDFSTSSTSMVKFSQGNLQYKANSSTWRFANWQTDAIGGSNSVISANNSTWIDLFGWGTSGYNGKMPYMASTNDAEYGDGQNDLTETQYDWGAQNAIPNGGNRAGLWRTLSDYEWNYLLNTRTASTVNGTANARYCKATVSNRANCIILFPNTYTHPESVSLPTAINDPASNFSDNSFTLEEWLQMDDAGCVMLPAGGTRQGTNVNGLGANRLNTLGSYWSSSHYSTNNALVLDFADGSGSLVNAPRSIGASVRLVHGDDCVAVDSIPTVSTGITHSINATSAACDGEVIRGGGVEVTDRGLCWSTSPTPTLADNHATCGAGLGTFIGQMTGLTANTTYYVRAYATNSVGTAYGDVVQFTTQRSGFAEGSLNGLFSTSPSNKVRFSQGNLQYQASTDTWRFADHQYDYMGDNNAHASSTYSGWIDAYCWATSGYNDGLDSLDKNHHPWSTVLDNGYHPSSQKQFVYNYYGFGPSGYNYNSEIVFPNISGSHPQYDWGAHNPISNGGNASGLWYTMTKDQWDYLLYTREASTLNGVENARWCLAEVNGTHVLILFPDTYRHPDNLPLPVAINGTQSFRAPTSNQYTAEQWEQMEAAGCVLLTRTGTSTFGEWTNTYDANYWTSTNNNSQDAIKLTFYYNINPITGRSCKNEKSAVRLVRNAAATTGEPSATTISVTNIGSTSAVCTGETFINGYAEEYVCGFNYDSIPERNWFLSEPLHIDGHISSTITGLHPNTTYYVKAYVYANHTFYYGDEISFTTLGANDDGALAGQISNSDSTTVRFSKGNLEYQASTDTWRFADNQHTYSTSGTVSINSSDWIDKFGYGTSGYDDLYPYNNSSSCWDYAVNDIANTQYDWGVHNAIANGGNQAGLWRTLTTEEWDYILNQRQASTVNGVENARYFFGKVDSIYCMIIFPDNYSHPIDLEAPVHINYSQHALDPGNNIYTFAEWEKMEALGCVMMMQIIDPTTMNQGRIRPHYWTSWYWPASGNAYYGYCSATAFVPSSSNYDTYTTSDDTKTCNLVRLVRNGDGSRSVNLPTVHTSQATGIDSTSATCSGNVAEDGGDPVIARGICWSSMPNPTLDDNFTTEGLGLGTFSSRITGLAPNSPYYVRAYATNGEGTSYGEEVVFQTKATYGRLNGVFSTSDTSTAWFSQGNLQYNIGNYPAVWRFAEHQYDYVGADNTNIADNYHGWIDLFGWGTSGWMWKSPSMTSNNDLDYADGFNDIDSTDYDWGVHNNTALNGSRLGRGTWRTPTKAEWLYLLNTRSASTVNGTENARYFKAVVNGVDCIVLLPDQYTHPEIVPYPTSINVSTAPCSTNTYTAVQWQHLEGAGCVLLPAAGKRDITDVSEYGEEGRYWTSSALVEESPIRAKCWAFDDEDVYLNDFVFRSYGLSVRLVYSMNAVDTSHLYPPTDLYTDNIRLNSMHQSTATLHFTRHTDYDSILIFYSTTRGTPNLNRLDVGVHQRRVFADTCKLTDMSAGTWYYIYAAQVKGDRMSEWSEMDSVQTYTWVPSADFNRITTCNAHIYDDGGDDGNYSNRSYTTYGFLYIYPATEGGYVRLTGNYCTENACDKIVIYDTIVDRHSISSRHELARVSGTGYIDVVSPTGPLAIRTEIDYSINYWGFDFEATCVTCVPPDNVVFEETTSTTTIVSWDSPTPSSHEVQWAPYGNSNWYSQIVATGNTATITGLTPNSSYQVRVRSICDDDDESLWSETEIVSTEPTCFPPTNLYVSGETPNSAVLNWNEPDEPASQYEVVWGSDYYNLENSMIVNSQSSATINGLQSNTTYIAKVRSICGEGDTSDWSWDYDFTTPCGDIELPYHIVINSSNISHNNSMPDCWERAMYVNFDYPYATHTPDMGRYTLQFALQTIWSDEEQFAIMPNVPYRTDVANYQLRSMR